MKRYGQVIKVDEKNKELYIDYHKKVPKEIKDLIHQCNMRNYNIFIKDDLLFAYFEYVGNDFEADMKKMAENEDNKKWWELVRPFQIPLNTAKAGEFWADMDEVYYQE